MKVVNRKKPKEGDQLLVGVLAGLKIMASFGGDIPIDRWKAITGWVVIESFGIYGQDSRLEDAYKIMDKFLEPYEEWAANNKGIYDFSPKPKEAVDIGQKRWEVKRRKRLKMEKEAENDE